MVSECVPERFVRTPSSQYRVILLKDWFRKTATEVLYRDTRTPDDDHKQGPSFRLRISENDRNAHAPRITPHLFLFNIALREAVGATIEDRLTLTVAHPNDHGRHNNR